MLGSWSRYVMHALGAPPPLDEGQGSLRQWILVRLIHVVLQYTTHRQRVWRVWKICRDQAHVC